MLFLGGGERYVLYWCFLCFFTQTCNTLNINASAISRLLMNNENCLLYTAALSPQQGQSSSSPHPVSILSRPASSTFHDTPQPLLGLSQSRKTLSLERFLPPLPPLFVFLSSSSMGQTELYLHPFYLSSLCPLLSICPRLNQPPACSGLLPAGHTDPCWMKAVKA